MTYTPIAIVGYGCALPPRSFDPDRYWRAIMTGERGISAPPIERWGRTEYISPDRKAPEKSYCGLGGFLQDYSFSEPLPWSSTLRANGVTELNRSQQLIADTAIQAFTQAGYGPDSTVVAETGLFVGNMLGDETLGDRSLAELARVCVDRVAGELPASDLAAVRAQLDADLPLAGDDKLEAILPSGLATAVATGLGMRSQAVMVDGACASGLLVVDAAVRYLSDRPHCFVMAAGAMANMSITGNVSFAKIGGLSPDGAKPLDEHANGLIPSEGAAAFLLCSLAEALRRKLPVHGVIRGSATRTDGRGKAIYAPNTRGQAKAMQAAMDCGGFGPDDIDHVETHATGTPAGDAEEIRSIATVMTGRTRPPVSLGSVKALIGHGFPAAGGANLIKVLLSMDHGQFPPVHGVAQPHHLLGAHAELLRLDRDGGPWEQPSGRPRRALVNAFGFGGINSVVCVEQYDPQYHRSLAAQPEPSGRHAVAVVSVGRADEPDNDDLLDDSSSFDWRHFRVPPVLVPHMDIAQQLAMTAADRALADIDLTREDCGVVLGQPAGQEAGARRDLKIRLPEVLDSITRTRLSDGRAQAVADAVAAVVDDRIGATTEASLPGYMDNISAGRLGNQFNLQGPNVCVDTGAASFGAAVDLAYRYMAGGDCEAVLVGSAFADRTSVFDQLRTPRRATVMVTRPVEWARQHRAEVRAVIEVADCETAAAAPELAGRSAADWVAERILDGTGPDATVTLGQTFRPGRGVSLRVFASVAGFDAAAALAPAPGPAGAGHHETPAGAAGVGSEPSPLDGSGRSGAIELGGKELEDCLRSLGSPLPEAAQPVRIAFTYAGPAERAAKERVIAEALAALD